MEILAPVGGKQQLIAAVRSGANAVYLGAKGFNARRNAENFESCDLAETVRYCHSHNVKVHVTLNTLVTDDELNSLYETADEVAAAGVDAVIVQDMAVFRYLKTVYPELRLHASTQTVVHNASGAQFMKELGFSRVVLARELTIDEIIKINESVDIETEAFIHGALCMSVSGACYLSGMIGGRSGNRGLCAQPCRLDFRSGDREYALSLKDMSHIKYIEELEKAGVCSLKIEGRMKRPEYVAASVSACRAALEGRDYDEETLRAVFSRGGFTDGYITGSRDLDMFGHREKEDVEAAAKVLKDIENTYHKENQLLPVDMELTVSEDGCALRAECLGKTALVTGEPAIPARERSTDEALARQNLSRLGGTQFYLNRLTVNEREGLMVPPSALNAMRREAIGALDEKLGEKNEYEKHPFDHHRLDKTLPGRSEEPRLWARFFRAEQISDADGYEKIILPLWELKRNESVLKEYGGKVLAELPAVAFPEYEDRTEETVSYLAGLGLSGVYAENAYGITMSKKYGLDIYGGAGLNILNSSAMEIYEKQGLKGAAVSFELSLSRAEALECSVKKGIVAYGYLPLMRLRNCPAKTERGCGGCHGDRSLKDRRNVSFPILCEDRLFSTLLNSVPLHIADRRVRNTDFLLLYFTKESKTECHKIFDDYVNHRRSDEPRTGGLYFRTLA